MKRFFSASALCFIAIALAASALYYYNSAPRFMQDDIIYVNPGENTHSVAKRLKERNLIESETYFIALATLTKMNSIKPGKYRIERASSSFRILQKIYSGDIMKARVTIPEGFNLYSIAERMEKHGITKKDDFLFWCTNLPFLRSIGILAQTAEGYLFPDTYIFPEESDPKNVIKTMHQRLNSVLQKIDLSNMSKFGFDRHRLLTMASLIEKEAKLSSERPYISSVFHNRLKKRMKLDCDPTVRYATKRFTGPIYIADLRNPSPYNTYIHYGLPPTPICSPGKEAILAALNPASSEFLYFVARNDGSHVFSKTIKDHNLAVKKYQRKEKTK
ncbi:MAG: endolytic transglycosylase MltG [Spirochaetes bacterium]|nr:endolytic transglycosylase MltG [Spirochaetota bacterium]